MYHRNLQCHRFHVTKGVAHGGVMVTLAARSSGKTSYQWHGVMAASCGARLVTPLRRNVALNGDIIILICLSRGMAKDGEKCVSQRRNSAMAWRRRR